MATALSPAIVHYVHEAFKLIIENFVPDILHTSSICLVRWEELKCVNLNIYYFQFILKKSSVIIYS